MGISKLARCPYIDIDSDTDTGVDISRIKNGEGNGTPLQYSCLENPTDGGAW